MLLIVLAACGPSDKPDGSANAPTWYQDVSPIVAQNCGGCHRAGGPGFDLTTVEGASAQARAMADAVAERRMPPFGVEDTDDCAPVRDWAVDRRLSDADIATIVAWAEADAPEGDADDAAPFELPAVDTLDGIGEELTPVAPYSTYGGADEFMCFSIDPGFTEDVWVDRIELDPSNRGIAHHSLVLLDGPAVSADYVNDDGWYDCSQGLGLDSPELLYTWVPGASPLQAPAGTGTLLSAGARIVLQMHYHPGGSPGEQDLPTLRYTRLSSRPQRALHQTLIGNAATEAGGLLPGPNDSGRTQFLIPAGASGHTETMAATFPDGVPEIPVAAAGAHMHLIASQMKIWVERAHPAAGEDDVECLLPATRYDYDWQELYRYAGEVDDFPTVSGGDRLVIECTYDNTLDHAGTRRALSEAGLDEPVDVRLGEGTLDEMCLGMFGYIY